MKPLVQLAGCEKYYRLLQLNLLDTGSKRTKLFNRAAKYLVTDLIREGQNIQEDTILPRLKAHFGQKYVPEDFACAKECEAERQADYRKLERFKRCLQSQHEGTVLSSTYLIVPAPHILRQMPFKHAHKVDTMLF